MTATDGLTVAGGPAGTAARIEDLLAAARLLMACAVDLAGVATAVGRVGTDAGLVASAITDPVVLGRTLARAEHAVAVAVGGPHGLLAAAGHVTALGVALQATAAGYAAAESGAAAAARAVDVAVGAQLGGLAALTLATPAPLAAAAVVLAGPDGRTAAGRVAGAVAGDVLTRAAGRTERLVAAVPGLVGGLVPGVPAGPGLRTAPRPGPTTVPQTAALLLAVAAAGGLLADPARVSVRSSPPRRTTAPGGVADLARLVAAASPDGGGTPGSVRVTRLDAADGRRAWVVAVPGTQVWTPRAGRNPFDVTSDIRSIAGRDSAAAAAVVAAMRSAGVRSGEPVCLVGHSLGGMVSAEVAADPAVRSEFAVREVVALGSPVAEYPLARDVGVLALEHTDDLVPALDGAPNPDRSTWVTVRRTAAPPGVAPDPGVAHDLEGYVRTATLVDASRDPGVVAARDRLAPFLPGPRVTATTVEVTATRSTAPAAGLPGP